MHSCAKLGFLQNNCYSPSGEQTHASAEVTEHLLKLRTSALWTVQGVTIDFYSNFHHCLYQDGNQYKAAMGGVQVWQWHRESKHWQYEMIQKLLMTSVVPVIPVKSYYYGTTWSLFPSPSPIPSPELSYVATKGAFTPADDRREAESWAGSHFSPAKCTLGQWTESRGEWGRRQCYSKGLCTPSRKGPGDASAASILDRGPYSKTTSPRDRS